MTDYLVPAGLLALSLMTLRRQENCYDRLLEGAAQGLKLALQLVPTLVLLMTSVKMLQSSGAFRWLGQLAGPGLRWLGIPPETAMLVLIRPISGSAALAVGTQLMAEYGPDSLVGTTAAVMLGSSETTFYTISVYFGAAGIQKTRYALPAALMADAAGFLCAAWTTRLLFPEIGP